MDPSNVDSYYPTFDRWVMGYLYLPTIAKGFVTLAYLLDTVRYTQSRQAQTSYHIRWVMGSMTRGSNQSNDCQTGTEKIGEDHRTDGHDRAHSGAEILGLFHTH
jgi:hypothetical protein